MHDLIRELGITRFRVRRRLGAGSYGTVYEVDDHDRGDRVAVKVLAERRPEALYRFKREFRALSDVSHPNLVALHELLAVGDQWLFTMELVDGTDFLAHVRGEPRLGGAGALDRGGYARLRDALRQLATGVEALHRAGQLHRDVKPSNVLVTAEGRVVLLDFGLVSELGPDGLGGSTTGQLVGTAAYMAPEQAVEGRLTTMSDWYSVGVMMFEALTGRLPFSGTDLAVLVAKQQGEPPPAHEIVPDAPRDLSALCAGLLRRDPALRTSGEQLLRALREEHAVSRAPGPGGSAGAPDAPARAEVFVGRERDLATLAAALQATAEGRPVAVHVYGKSGLGKSALVRHFVDGLAAAGTAVVLQGRCYERESVPYKGVDALVDALTHYLSRLPREDGLALLPRDIHALVRLFPVLERVRVLADEPRRVGVPPDAQEFRRRAFASFRDLLTRIAERRPLVLWLDDFQWGDLDSVALLTHLVRPPDSPPLLLVLSFRDEDVTESAALQAFLAPAAAAERGVETRDLALAPLGEADAYEAAAALLGGPGAGGTHAVLTRAIARESGGNPFFLGELARFFRSAAGAALVAPTEAVTLDAVIRARVAHLPDAACRLLEVVAVSGIPLPRPVAFEAAGIRADDPEPLAVLRGSRFVRPRGAQDGHVEVYHDRIREAVLAALPPDRLGERHRALAAALQASGRSDPEALATHLAAAGRTEAASGHALVAADQAAVALAFDRAARLYRLALDLLPNGDARRYAAFRGLGDALANAGHGEAAAGAYVEAAVGAADLDAVELRRRAAEELFRGGYVQEGWRIARVVLESVGLAAPTTMAGTIASWAWHRGRLALRGLRAPPASERALSPRELARVDVCWTLSLALGVSDPVRGADFQARHLLRALDAGDAYRYARALATEVAYSALSGTAGAAQTARVAGMAVDAGGAVANAAERAHAAGFATLMCGVGAYLEGRFPEAARLCAAAEAHLKQHCAGVPWDITSAQLFHVRALEFTGQVAERVRRAEPAIVEAEEHSDLYAALSQRTLLATGVLLRDDAPDQARRAIDDALARWAPPESPVQQFEQMETQLHIELYAGEFERAERRLHEGLLALVRRSLLLRVQLTRILFHDLRLRCALGLASRRGPGWQRWARAAERDARRLAAEHAPWAEALALLGRAGLAAVRGDDAAAVARLRAAVRACEGAGMLLHAAAARRRCGELLGGDEGAALVAAADGWMATQHIRSPARVTAFLVSGGR